MASSSRSCRNQKRPLSESTSDMADNNNNNPQPMMKRHSFLSVALLVIQQNQLEKIIEPVLRKVVIEEMERAVMWRPGPRMTRSPSFRIQAPEPLPLHLVFVKPLKSPLFTLNKLVSEDASPLRVILLDPRSDLTPPFVTLPSDPIKIQIVALPGDFPHGDRTNWSAEEFNDSILMPRQGKRPLITGKLTAAAAGSVAEAAAEFTDLQFTDNSSWTRSGKFRLGAQLVVEGHSGNYAGLRVLEAVTEPFIVRDHRGEPYMKHYPPRLEDDVWRLERIRKRGPFHDSLSSNGVNTVQDLLKMSVVDPDKLQAILGPKMAAKKWKAVMNHANTCEMGSKLYVYYVASLACDQTAVVLDPVCHVVGGQINGQIYSVEQFSSLVNVGEEFIGNVVREAYSNWNTLEEVDRCLIESAVY